MLGSVLGSLQELVAMLRVSAQTVNVVTLVTVIVSVSVLTGCTCRIGVWFEDLMYRLGMWGGWVGKKQTIGIDDPSRKLVLDPT